MEINKEMIMTQQTALSEYNKRQAEIKKVLKQIEAGLQKHDRKASTQGGHNWGHVGDIGDMVEVLTDLKDRLHNTGEYAKG